MIFMKNSKSKIDLETFNFMSLSAKNIRSMIIGLKDIITYHYPMPMANGLFAGSIVLSGLIYGTFTK